MFHCGRIDILPVGDLGVRKGFQALYKLKVMPGSALPGIGSDMCHVGLDCLINSSAGFVESCHLDAAIRRAFDVLECQKGSERIGRTKLVNGFLGIFWCCEEDMRHTL